MNAPHEPTHDAQAAALERLLIATAAAGIAIREVDRDGGAVHANERLRELCALPPTAPAPDDAQWLQFVHEADRSRVRAALERLRAEGGRDTQEHRLLRADGRVLWVRVSALAVTDRGGEVLRRVDTILDITAEREAAAERERLLQRLQLATGSGNLGIWELDVASGRELWDDAVCRMLGVGAGPQVRGSGDFMAMVVPEDRDRVLASFTELLQSDADRGGPISTRIVRPDGALRDLTTSLAIERDAEGRAVRVIGLNTDVTELRAAERRATETAQRLAFATSAAGKGVWQWEIASGAIEWDEITCRLFDVPSGHARDYADFRARLHPDDVARVERQIRAALAGGAPYDTDFRIRTPAGEERVIASRGEVVRDHNGLPQRMVGINWDITAARRAERQALEVAERLRLAADAAGIGCWEIAPRSDGGWDDATWDDRNYRLFGASPADGPTLALWWRALHPEDRATVDSAMRAAIAGSGEFAATFRIRRIGDGELRWLSSRGAVKRRADGSVERVVGVSWDVTEARVAESALRAKETAERANRAKSEFLSRMSHELRTPLNALIGFTQLLEMDAGDPLSPTQRERVGLIRSSGWHLLNLIDDVLDLTRIESGRASVQMEVVAWSPVLQEAVGMVQPEAAARGIALQTLATPGVAPTLWADRTRLRQVLINLLSNAVKYNRDRGSVSVTVRADGDAVLITVADTGRGLTPEQMARLFQPFDRLGMEATELAGSGIGLAISQRLLQQMDGTLAVRSTPGVGSEFTVRLRASQVEPAGAARAPAPLLTIDDSVAGTVLYIEDNPANSALMEQFLQFRPRVKLYQAADGATGLVMAGVCRPDLVLIDIRLPDMMGDEVLAQLRAQPATAAVPAVAVSANAMPHDIRAALAAGFTDYWTKPLEATRFLQGVDALLRAAGAPPPQR